MTKRRILGIAVAAAGLWLPAACEQTLRTGKVGNTTNAPNLDGTCPAGLGLCGRGAFAQCLDLQNDRAHCGACDNACLPGIACVAGACQQVACAGPVTVSVETLPETTAPTGLTLAGALLADVNGDGRPDLVSWTQDGAPTKTFQVALGDPSGGFGAASTYQAASGVSWILAADWNADGFEDLYVSELYDSGCFEIWLGQADGKLRSAPDVGDAGCVNPGAVADLNGDGNLDMVAFNPLHAGKPPALFFADAKGAFHVGISLPIIQYGLVFLVRDWNRDGFPDLVNVANVLSVYLNKGNGTFADEMNCGVLTSSPQQTVIADFNYDGYLDLAVAMMEGGIGVLLGMGGCQFQPMREYPFSGQYLHPHAGDAVGLVHADVDGDGLGDLVARTVNGEVFLLHGEADGTFQIVQLSSGHPCSGGCPLLVGDFTGDGKVDVVVAGGWQTVTEPGQPPTQFVQPAQILGNTCL